MRTGTILRLAPVVLWLTMGCGGKQGGAASPTTTDAPAPSAAASSPTPAAMGPGPAPVSSAPATPPPRPFANTPIEAQSLIQEQIDAHIKPLWKCVNDYRAKKGDPHKALVVDIGIDQEGTLLGVTTPNMKGQVELDPATRDCMRQALHGLPFPRSHAGIITVRQSFTDALGQ